MAVGVVWYKPVPIRIYRNIIMGFFLIIMSFIYDRRNSSYANTRHEPLYY